MSELTKLQFIPEKETFALYRFPSDNKIYLIEPTNPAITISINDLNQGGAGFIVFPFLGKEGYKIVGKQTVVDLNFLNHLANKTKQTPTTNYFDSRDPAEKNEEEYYKSIVEKAKKKIHDGFFEKVVLARKKNLPYKGKFNGLVSFLNLCSAYPTAMVSYWSIENVVAFIGATPETLAKSQNNYFETESLAGTKRLNQNIEINQHSWTTKEIEEQALVTRYIINCFKKLRYRFYEEKGPKTIRAGNLVHLQTKIRVKISETGIKNFSTNMLQLLHPTPAVCGMPKQPAENFITENEKIERGFYSGYLGPFYNNEEFSLYVNLRCAKIENNKIIIYAGAGIMEDSDPQAELEETNNKMNILTDKLL